MNTNIENSKKKKKLDNGKKHDQFENIFVYNNIGVVYSLTSSQKKKKKTKNNIILVINYNTVLCHNINSI